MSVSETRLERLDEPGDGDARGVDVEIGDEDRTDGECKYKVGKLKQCEGTRSSEHEHLHRRIYKTCDSYHAKSAE